MGGTIEFHDPAYDAMNTRLLKIDASIDSYLKNLIQPHFTWSSFAVTDKDSRDIDETDRERLFKAIVENEHKYVVVPHGTFTMAQTGKFLEGRDLKGKTVVLTGSMIPISGFSASDAGFNLGYVIGQIEHLEPGVYLSMNGCVFSPDEVAKNTELLRFE